MCPRRLMPGQTLALRAIAAFTICAILLTSLLFVRGAARLNDPPQKSFPDPPNDLTRVYYLSAEEKLLPLPFEAGLSSLNVFVPAPQTKVARVHLNGPRAATVLTNDNPCFYVFVGEKMDPPPHQLVRLASNKSGRELAISVIEGRKGYAPFASDNVKLEWRMLERLRVESGKNRYLFVNYMELRPHTPLKAGEYAIIGDSITDMATFRIK